MRKLSLIIIAVLTFSFANAQQKDIPISELLNEVKEVIDEYVKILSTSKNLDECAVRFLKIAGGGLVNPAGTKLRNSVKPYSLKRDFTNIKSVRIPVVIARVAKTKTGQSGFGKSAIAGDWYKVYIEKVEGGGRPTPVHVVVPINHPTIKVPKIIQIGSF